MKNPTEDVVNIVRFFRAGTLMQQLWQQHDIDYVVLGEEDKHTNEKDEGETVLSAGDFIPDGCWMRGKETGKRHGAFYDLPVSLKRSGGQRSA